MKNQILNFKKEIKEIYEKKTLSINDVNNIYYYSINPFIDEKKNFIRIIDKFSESYDVYYIVEKKNKKYFLKEKELIIFFFMNFNYLFECTQKIIIKIFINNNENLKNENLNNNDSDSEEKKNIYETLEKEKTKLFDILNFNLIDKNENLNKKIENFEKKLNENIEIKNIPQSFYKIEINEINKEKFISASNNKYRKFDFNNYVSKKNDKMKIFFVNLVFFSFLNGINFFNMIEYLFLNYHSFFLYYLFKFKNVSNNSNICLQTISDKLYLPSLSKTLLLKDRINLSDGSYDYLRKFLNLEFYLPSLNNLISFRKKIDLIIFKTYEFKILNTGVICSPLILLKNIILAFNNYLNNYNDFIQIKNGYKKLQPLDKNLIFKYSIDGSDNYIFGGYQLLNNDVYKNKSCKGWFLNSVQMGIYLIYLFFLNN
jgi:hypothetical protein